MSGNIESYDSPCKISGQETNHSPSINNLPKDVITHIISLLPLVDAVRTSVLSKDWEYNWTSIYRIEINDAPLEKASFVNFIDNILLHCQDIQSFSLSSHHKHGSAILKRWISSLSMRSGIKSIDIDAFRCRGSTLPRCLLDSTSLTSLRLCLPCSMKVPSKDYFRNLRKLHLILFHFEKEDITNNDRLTLTLPVLVQLRLSGPTWGSNVKLVDICSPSLTCFTYSSCKAPPNDFLIKVSGAKLEMLVIYGDVLIDNFDVNASSIPTVVIKNASQRCDHPLVGVRRSNSRLSIKDFSALKLLWICARPTKTYAQLMPGHGLPRFDMLQSLNLQICGSIQAFLEILHMAPTLKTLVLAPHPEEGHYSQDFDFDGVGSVPSCMSSHLRKITFLNLLGTTCELRLLKFMLKNSVKLEDFIISVVDEPSIPKTIIEELLTSPKGSTRVSLVVT